MKGIIYIDENKIGETDFTVMDESMGGISGELIPNKNYEKYKSKIQELSKKIGIANIDDFNFRILLNNEHELKPQGGIGIIDIEGNDEIIVESAGLEFGIIEKIKNAL